MSITAVLLPVYVQVALTVILLLWMRQVARYRPCGRAR